MAHQCQQETRITVLEAKSTSLADDVSEIKWLVRIGLGGMVSLLAFLLKAKLGW